MESKYKRVVVKIGTSTLTAGTSRINLPCVVSIAQQFVFLISQGIETIFVSSGAIAAGREALGDPELPKSIPGKQMLAAVGQPRLMNIYEQVFGIYDIPVAQVLLTNQDISNRKRYLNARNTLDSLLRHSVLPIVNENDTVATSEIRIGDNDNLSALVANLVEADLLILLTDQDGLFTADPKKINDAKLIDEIKSEAISETIWEGAGLANGSLGTGGMITKLQAAETARQSGTAVVIANGSAPDVIQRIVQGEQSGTFFHPVVDAMESRKRFMVAGAAKDVWLSIDQGAAEALRNGGSLLPVGITRIEGEFGRGDIIRVKTNNGEECAVGLVDYSSEEIQKIMKRKSSEIEKALGYAYGDEVIHHNNMVILRSES